MRSRRFDFRSNDLGCFPKIFGDEGGPRFGRWGKLADFALPAANEDYPASGARSGKQIRNSIADHVALFEWNLQVAGRPLEQSYLGFAATAAPPQFRQLCSRMVEAIVDSVDAPSGPMNRRKHFVIECLECFRLQAAFCDSWLIRNNGDFQSKVVQ